jgi:2-dehydropantoate 2-reductase
VDVLICGAGAVGSFFGYLLSEPERDGLVKNVALLGRESHILQIKKSGLKIKLFNEIKSLRFKHCYSRLDQLASSNFHPSITVVCVKTRSLSELHDDLKSSGLLHDRLKEVSFILLMNGMGNRENFALPSHRVFEGITSMGVTFPENGLIELKGVGDTLIDEEIPREIKQFMREQLAEKGFEIHFPRDFKRHQWTKLFANAVINPLTALTGETNGIVLSRAFEKTAEFIVEECVGVARQEGMDFDKERVLEMVRSIAEKTSRNTSSMLQDILREKRTEIDSINGYVIGLGHKHGVAVKVNETLYSLVKAKEAQYPDAQGDPLSAMDIDY